MTLKLLIIHPDDAFRKHLSEHMRLENYRVVETSPMAEAMEILQNCRFDVILLKTTPASSRWTVLGQIKTICPETEVILLTPQDEHTLHGAIQAMRMGAFDELIVPLDIGVLQRRIKDAHEGRRKLETANRPRSKSQKEDKKNRVSSPEEIPDKV